MKTFSERLLALSTERGLSRADMARIAKISPPSMSLWFSGETLDPKALPLIRVANALGVNPEWLLTGHGNKQSVKISSEISDSTLSKNETWPFPFARVRFDRLPEPRRERINGFALSQIMEWEEAATQVEAQRRLEANGGLRS